jgi:hypothetical protein
MLFIIIHFIAHYCVLKQETGHPYSLRLSRVVATNLQSGVIGTRCVVFIRIQSETLVWFLSRSMEYVK